MLATPSPPGLAEATKASTAVWQDNLEQLFRSAKDRFPDVVWELTADDDDDGDVLGEVWGHKGIVYARAPPSFQSRYFSFRQPFSPTPSAVSLTTPPSVLSRSPSPMRPASPSSTTNPTTSLLRISTSINPALFSNELEYLYTGKGFGEAFEFLFDSADAHDQPENADPDDLRVDKLRKDLVYMWRSRLYSDVRIALTGHDNTTAIFSSHRFILVSRCPYFHDALVSWPAPAAGELTLPSPPFTPASLHFTLGYIYTGTLVFSHRSYDLSTAFAILKAALYLSLNALHDEIQARIAHEMLHGLFHAFLPFQEYERITASKWGTGGCRCRQCARRAPRVLEFSLEEDVKNTHLERGARRALVGLYGEGWCTQEFASLNQKLRESLLKGVSKRTTPQNVFPLLFAAEHALLKLASNIDSWADTVRDMVLSGRKNIDEVICKDSEAAFSSDEWMEIMDSDGARFGDTERVEWAMAAVLRGVKESYAATLYQTLVSSVLLKPHPTEPNSAFLPSTSQIRQHVEQTRIEILKWISKRWMQIRQEHGFDSLEGWTLKEISDYMEVPIEDLYSPAPVTRNTPPRNKLLRPQSNHPHTSRLDADSEATSMRASVLSRNVNSRRGPSVRDNASVHSLASSVRTAKTTISTSSAASDSTIGRSAGISPARQIVQNTRARDATRASKTPKDRPDSKYTPQSPSPSPTPQPSVTEDEESENEEDTTGPDTIKKTVITRASIASVTSRASSARNNTKPASVHSLSPAVRKAAVSVTSRNSQAKSHTTAGSRPVSRTSTRPSTAGSSSRVSTSRTTSTISSRSVSTVSTTSTTSHHRSSTASTHSSTNSFLTAGSSIRPRKTSAASTSSVRTAGASSPTHPRTRKVSAASVSSVSSTTASSSAYGTAKTSISKSTAPPVPSINPAKVTSAAQKSKPAPLRSVRSASSIKKTASATGGAGSKKASPVPSAPVSPNKSIVPLPAGEDKENQTPDDVYLKNASSSSTIKAQMLAESDVVNQTEHKKSASTASTGSNATIKKKRSNETIIADAVPSPLSKSRSSGGSIDKPHLLHKPQPPLPDVEPSSEDSLRGVCLDIGIPCIVSSKRKRFKAYARYIGEVEGELGPWVGVEVPIPLGESWADRDGDSSWQGTLWNDGTWGGVRYFEIGYRGSDWDYDDRATRRRRVDVSGGSVGGSGLSMKGSLKREGEQLMMGMERMKRMRSVSPAVSDSAAAESRGLFVRPQQILYVVDAVEDL
ncbi:hypothetical protein AGABI1DRAFT_132857 [Agaricus bisporus var. burnettii JB137-S8]|uniref:BTB domain-containing protein n=3 Tax=Agaricus bisporus TaxID=5341 RepID=K5WHR3_AGABU|nr:uncharacterized protein AGABI1DRAFT_132857 [Agaricus bisporus var. burnettii JB137-S8]EKM74816.1 hypothetical protein AGABI1DRAFT_132857 [Agaricus bisporus var. burnettii JB137-S8]